jgi:hypothetical protein
MRSTHHRIAVLLLLSLGGMALAAQAPAGATAKCKDGTYSTAKSSKGRCSNHGGVAQLLNTTSTSTSSAATTTTRSTGRTSTAAGGVPIGATFQCKDGSYSTAKTTTGACSRHGGVDHSLGGGAAATSPAPTSSRSTSTAPAGGAPSGATFQCKDGSYSTAKTSQGACSRHGGVDHSLTASAAAGAPASTTPAAAAGASTASGKAPTVTRPGDAPANATAKCRDGTYSASQTHSGSCSHHGGVAEWYQ